mmetsp:Transcript_29326/g.38569  ORF Transcript_29326/g.38569 Transcript_29326/m.38569 type:complete len:593 (-) Transcript_29326:33-1811(-)|eukprot:CAMPEP_0117742318 /NCGR_PEP_ID=MMETSP0947-20121206/5478_1 /TAXON_ID=44440 /ORGANISM="Chattonella subsalsa, Strain CCMP2191" /LENGTH=592 /DNA_ID=CAMNT_0005558825 /DNA_START=243 /DNA_END=2024 /DNA_ORIENTATION=+
MGNTEGSPEVSSKVDGFYSAIIEDFEQKIIIVAQDEHGMWIEFPASIEKCLEISPKFKDLMDKQNKLNQEQETVGSTRSIHIYDISAELFDRILKYSYGLDTEIDSSMLWPLRKIGKKYQITDLVEDIDDLLFENLSTKNFCKTYIGYSNAKDFDMLQKCVDHIQHLRGNHKELITSKYFLKLRMNPDLRLLLQSRDLDVDEELIWSRCIEWARNQNRMSEKVALRQIALDMEFGLMNRSFLQHNVYPILEECSEKDEKHSVASNSSSSGLDSDSSLSELHTNNQDAPECCWTEASSLKGLAEENGFLQPELIKLDVIHPKADFRKRPEKLYLEYSIKTERCSTPYPERAPASGSAASSASSSPLTSSEMKGQERRPKFFDFEKYNLDSPVQLYGSTLSSEKKCDGNECYSAGSSTSCSPLNSDDLRGQYDRPKKFTFESIDVLPLKGDRRKATEPSAAPVSMLRKTPQTNGRFEDWMKKFSLRSVDASKNSDSSDESLNSDPDEITKHYAIKSPNTDPGGVTSIQPRKNDSFPSYLSRNSPKNSTCGTNAPEDLCDLNEPEKSSSSSGLDPKTPKLYPNMMPVRKGLVVVL